MVSETRTIAGKAHTVAYVYDAANQVTPAFAARCAARRDKLRSPTRRGAWSSTGATVFFALRFTSRAEPRSTIAATGRIASVKTRKTALDPAVDIATAIARRNLR